MENFIVPEARGGEKKDDVMRQSVTEKLLAFFQIVTSTYGTRQNQKDVRTSCVVHVYVRVRVVGKDLDASFGEARE